MRSALEVRNLFNLKYQNLNSGVAPGLNDYEISLYLTEGKKQIIDYYYSDNLKGSIDENERVKKYLSVLVKPSEPIELNDLLDESVHFPGYYTYKVELENNVWRVLEERISRKTTDECLSSIRGDVIPTNWDILRDTLENPFRRPNNKIVLRVDIDGCHYLISKSELNSYMYTYLEFPKPYIITDLNEFMTDFDLEDNGNPNTIDGISEITLNELDHFIDDLIINRAVELAIKDYRENSLSTNISLNQRSL